MSEHTPEQIASAYATLDLALKHSNALNMGTWVSIPDGDGITVNLAKLTAECGTTACYAGWHVARLGYEIDQDGDVETPGGFYQGADYITRQDLGLSEDSANRLFLKTSADDLEEAIRDEFGPRPDPA